LIKKTFESKPEGRRKVGRPRLRWLDDVENDLKSDEGQEVEEKGSK
jgi:hypothetical protein